MAVFTVFLYQQAFPPRECWRLLSHRRKNRPAAAWQPQSPSPLAHPSADSEAFYLSALGLNLDFCFWLIFSVFKNQKALKTQYFSYFKHYLHIYILSDFLEKIDGGPYKHHFQNYCLKSGAYRDTPCIY